MVLSFIVFSGFVAVVLKHILKRKLYLFLNKSTDYYSYIDDSDVPYTSSSENSDDDDEYNSDVEDATTTVEYQSNPQNDNNIEWSTYHIDELMAAEYENFEESGPNAAAEYENFEKSGPNEAAQQDSIPNEITQQIPNETAQQELVPNTSSISENTCSNYSNLRRQMLEELSEYDSEYSGPVDAIEDSDECNDDRESYNDFINLENAREILIRLQNCYNLAVQLVGILEQKWKSHGYTSNNEPEAEDEPDLECDCVPTSNNEPEANIEAEARDEPDFVPTCEEWV